MNAPLTLLKPTKADRIEAFRRANWPERAAMHDAIAAQKTEAIAVRRELGRRYLEQHPDGCVIPRERAVASLDLIAETAAIREEAIGLADGRGAQANNGSLEFPVLAHDFPADSLSLRFGMDPVVLAPIVRYCGMLPVLFNMFVTRAHTTEFLPNSAHMFHLDPEDVISFKVFIHLTDVDDDSGPFHALPADLTQNVLGVIDYRGIGRITDEQVDALVGFDNVVKFLGPAGTIALADTTRCLHFGGRPRKEGKPVRDMLVYQYLLPTSFLFPIDGDSKHPRFFPQLEPTGDDFWDALIGARFT
jgi:hypothetical protein